MAQAITSNDLDEVERSLKFEFPAAFREHYLRFNGGYPATDRFVDETGICIVQDFLPIKFPTPPLSTFEQSFRRLKVESQLLPDHLIPFAVDPGGDYYCFSTNTQNRGSILLFHMDHWNDPTRGTETLAASLPEFLSRLKSKDELKGGVTVSSH